MSPQETQALQDFLNQLTQVRGLAKDPQADAMIARAVAQQPESAYLLVQRALLMEQALNGAKAQIAALQNQVQSLQATSAGAAAESSRGFLDGNVWGNSAPAAPSPVSQPVYASRPAPAPLSAQQASAGYQVPPQAAASAAANPGFFNSGFGSTLGSIATTAAGVAGGAFLFQGIEHLMNGGNSGGGWTHQSGMAPVENIENTTVNNYYVSDSDRGAASEKESFDAGSNNDSLADNSDCSDFSDSSDFDGSLI
ncbi:MULTISPECIES: DUF2076 domain-containing protein [unclassified Herbaspirillum]|uniref:DUF2076 domain-containing protein n=1 Tax=unclassified Herbaspirillum TaxID=2624150 RepID=UPI00161F4CFD|nr:MULTISPECIES: DUF2076 domain-containing protein [unclassified Herbaspirillum]